MHDLIKPGLGLS